MSQKSSLPQVIQFVSEALMPDNRHAQPMAKAHDGAKHISICLIYHMSADVQLAEVNSCSYLSAIRFIHIEQKLSRQDPRRIGLWTGVLLVLRTGNVPDLSWQVQPAIAA
jgi:hypothetical protein